MGFNIKETINKPVILSDETKQYLSNDKITYKDKLKNPLWQAKRLDILKRDKYKCTICNSTLNLEVHHLYYIPKLEPWEYDNDGLKTVCNLHHDILTYELPKLAGLIAFEVLIKHIDL